VRVVDDDAGFASLRDPWNALAASVPARTVFLTHEWFDAAWQWCRESARLRLLCGYRGEELVAVCPLVLEESGSGARRVRALEFLTVPDTQWCDLIVAPLHREQALNAFVDELTRRRAEWDTLSLRYLAAGSVAVTSLLAILRSRSFSVHHEVAVSHNPYVDLTGSWDAYYATRTRSLKKASNLAANRLKKAGRIRIERLAPGAGGAPDLDRVVDVITAISASSWKSRTGNSLDNRGPQAFVRRLSHQAHARGWLSVWVLYLEDKPLAMEYQLVADRNVYALRSDFDAAREEISPGSHLARVLLEQSFGQGLGRYFMGPGDNAYKFRWTEQAEPMAQITAFNRTLRGRALATWSLRLKPAVRRVRDALSREPRLITSASAAE
jgi:CelD/BcsL family acetyltransferase involved in cellulose biosynthesis